MHDSWGCKSCVGCKLSIIFMTSLFAKEDKGNEQEVIEEAQALDAKADRIEESKIRELWFRVLAERETRIT